MKRGNFRATEPVNTEVVGTKVSKELRAKIEQVCKAQRKPISQYVREILETQLYDCTLFKTGE